MKLRMKTIAFLAVMILATVLSACGPKDGIIKELSFAENTQKAYLYTRKQDGKKEYCISLIGADETLDTEAEANVYETPYKPDIQVGTDTLLMVSQNEKDKTMKDFITVNGVEVVFGTMSVVNP